MLLGLRLRCSSKESYQCYRYVDRRLRRDAIHAVDLNVCLLNTVLQERVVRALSVHRLTSCR